MHNNTWIIVANSSQAKVFKLVRFPQIEALLTLDHPESRLHNQELVEGKPGRSFQSTGTARSAYQPKTDPHQHEIEKFAKFLGEYLNTAKANKDYKHLYLFASPSFLGMLRPYLDDSTKESILAEANKDMIDHPTEDIERQLSLLHD
jgi:protein required for attachment to host cells